MLLQALILVVIAASLAEAGPLEDMKELLKGIANDCLKTNPISQEEMALIHTHTFPESLTLQCFMGCLLKTPGFIGEDDMVDEDFVVGMMQDVLASDPDLRDKMVKLIQGCAKEANSAAITTEDKSCGRGAVAFVCLRDNKDKYGVSLID